jgi:YVTN family beta-propeller protein
VNVARHQSGEPGHIGVAAAGDNAVFVVDARTMKEVARIPVGQVPKRNATAR